MLFEINLKSLGERRCDGGLHFGVTGDLGSAPDVAVLADALEPAITELRRLALEG